MEILASELNDLDFLAFDLDWQRSDFKTNQKFENLFPTMNQESHASNSIENKNFESLNDFDKFFGDLDDDSKELLAGSIISDNTIFKASTGLNSALNSYSSFMDRQEGSNSVFDFKRLYKILHSLNSIMIAGTF